MRKLYAILALIRAPRYYIATFDKSGNNGRQWSDRLMVKCADEVISQLKISITETLDEADTEAAIEQVKKIIDR